MVLKSEDQKHSPNSANQDQHVAIRHKITLKKQPLIYFVSNADTAHKNFYPTFNYKMFINKIQISEKKLTLLTPKTAKLQFEIHPE